MTTATTLPTFTITEEDSAAKTRGTRIKVAGTMRLITLPPFREKKEEAALATAIHSHLTLHHLALVALEALSLEDKIQTAKTTLAEVSTVKITVGLTTGTITRAVVPTETVTDRVISTNGFKQHRH